MNLKKTALKFGNCWDKGKKKPPRKSERFVYRMISFSTADLPFSPILTSGSMLCFCE